jgi:predicted nucleic acid-binding protein
LNVFDDTSVWSLAFRRDRPQEAPQVDELARALAAGEAITTGIVLQELLQEFGGPKSHRRIIDHFVAVPLLAPDREDHIGAAGLRNACPRTGVQLGTIDALLARLCIRHQLPVLSTDQDFHHIAGSSDLVVWSP